jgi:hypothetical protein
MPQYAQFDPSAKSPASVIGWYDTDILKYPNLPAAAALIEVTASQWALHFQEPHGWAISNGQIIAPEIA